MDPFNNRASIWLSFCHGIHTFSIMMRIGYQAAIVWMPHGNKEQIWFLSKLNFNNQIFKKPTIVRSIILKLGEMSMANTIPSILNANVLGIMFFQY